MTHLGFSPSFDFGFFRIRAAPIPASTAQVATSVQRDGKSAGEIRQLIRYIAHLRDHLIDAQHAFRSSTSGSVSVETTSAEPVISTGAIGLNQTEFATKLVSTEELNTVATSFTPFGPAFTGSSTTLATIGGFYDGTNGDQTLTFEVKSAGTIGGNKKLELDVLDGSGNFIERVRWNPFEPAGTVRVLSNGLTVSLSAGNLANNDTFQVQVSITVDSAVDPTKPLNGVRNQLPNLQPGTAVVAGSFQINGNSILVNANDSINSVLAKINSVGLGITATYDASAERITLERQTPGPGPQIVLSNDISGFLAATKLSAVAATPGRLRDTATPFSQVAAFATVTAGTVRLDSTGIAVDPTVDTLEALLARINSDVPDLVANYLAAADKVELLPTGNRTSLAVVDQGTGLWNRLNIQQKTYEFVTEQLSLPTGRRRSAAAQLGGAQTARERTDASNSAIASIHQALFDVAARALEKNPQIKSVSGGLEVSGIRFQSAAGEAVITLDKAELSRAVDRNDRSLRRIFVDGNGSRQEKSVLTRIVDKLHSLERAYHQQLHELGTTFIEIRA